MSQNPAKTIAEVIENLNQIIEDSKLNSNYLGIFAYVYQAVTISVKQAIDAKRFDDNERMHQFDVAFANRYIDAYQKYQNKQLIPAVWKVAFDAKDEPLTILQHLFLGMHAHINFDLGLTAGLQFIPEEIRDFENDFMAINDILSAMTEEIQHKLFKSSYLLAFLDWLAKEKDEQVANFSIVNARKLSWQFACALAELPPNGKALLIEQTEAGTTRLSHFILKPKSKFIRTIYKTISWFEEKDVQQIIRRLEA